MNDKIEAYKDAKFMELDSNLHLLIEEELGFELSRIEIDENGRTLKDVRTELIKALEAMNVHLENKYPNNSVSTSYQAVNKFTLERLKEKIIGGIASY